VNEYRKVNPLLFRSERKSCFVSVVEVLGKAVTDLMSTNSNMEVREDRLKGTEAIENKITSMEQFGRLFSKVRDFLNKCKKLIHSSPGDPS